MARSAAKGTTKTLVISRYNRPVASISTLDSRGFTILEMVVVLVMIGLVTSLALPGLQRMYDSMAASLDRDEISFALNNLALDVRNQGTSLYFSNYPDNTDALPDAFLVRMKELQVKINAERPILITSAGFCPEAGRLSVRLASREYFVMLRTPDCRIELL